VILDSHTHAWPLWPYQPPVPDDEHRGKIEQLLHEMDLNGVERAVIICAQIDRNPDNNAYIAQQVARFPTRLVQFVDLDSVWTPTYHQPGSADRLKRMLDQWPIHGFTHYLAEGEDGFWLDSEEMRRVFQVAADHNLIVSLSAQPHQQAVIRRVAERFPSVPILCHHLGLVKSKEALRKEALDAVLASAKAPNIYIKLSGFAYSSQIDWNFPYTDTHPVVRAEYEHFGPQRMCWASDYPVVRFFMTYRQALEAFRTHCTFVADADREWILGRTLDGLLSRRHGLA
jgi:L-fuconolactonase